MSFDRINQNQLNTAKQSKMSGCNDSYGKAQHTPINAPNYDPFKRRPKIGRTPMIRNNVNYCNNENINYINMNQYHKINGSPIINSYFIPNTPIIIIL